MTHTPPKVISRAKIAYQKRELVAAGHPLVKLPPETRRAQAQLLKKKMTESQARKQMMCLLIAAHDEELVITQTIKSAIKAGMKPQNIYIVDDNSADKTSETAKSILGANNVIKVGRSGKGLALTKGATRFDLTNRYRWIHIADADGGFAPNYFRVFRGQLRSKYAVATGYIKSLPGGPVSQYRVFEYTIGLEIHRRFQALTHTVSVVPGPTSCFRSDVFAKVNFANHSLTEDFDVTLQVHRQKLGKIQFIPDAVAYTQDPKSTRDFIKQILRWNRGIMQGVHQHKIGRRNSPIDIYLSYQIMQNFLFFFNYCVVMPSIAIRNHSIDVAAQVFILDVLLTFVIALWVAARAHRWDILSAFPYIYIYRWVTMFVFLRAFIEVSILRQFRDTKGTWSTANRRYKPSVTI